MEWYMVSKAAERSSRQRQVTCGRPMALIRWSWMERSRVSVEWNFRYADWSGLKSWFRTRWSLKRDWTTRSTILDMVERLEIDHPPLELLVYDLPVGLLIWFGSYAYMDHMEHATYWEGSVDPAEDSSVTSPEPSFQIFILCTYSEKYMSHLSYSTRLWITLLITHFLCCIQLFV